MGCQAFRRIQRHRLHTEIPARKLTGMVHRIDGDDRSDDMTGCTNDVIACADKEEGEEEEAEEVKP